MEESRKHLVRNLESYIQERVRLIPLSRANKTSELRGLARLWGNVKVYPIMRYYDNGKLIYGQKKLKVSDGVIKEKVVGDNGEVKTEERRIMTEHSRGQIRILKPYFSAKLEKIFHIQDKYMKYVRDYFSIKGFKISEDSGGINVFRENLIYGKGKRAVLEPEKYRVRIFRSGDRGIIINIK